MKLAQNQVWKKGDEYIRIVVLERMKVHYKTAPTALTSAGEHHHVSKKEFCRLLKGARLLTQDELRGIEFGGGRVPMPAPGESVQVGPSGTD